METVSQLHVRESQTRDPLVEWWKSNRRDDTIIPRKKLGRDPYRCKPNESLFLGFNGRIYIRRPRARLRLNME